MPDEKGKLPGKSLSESDLLMASGGNQGGYLEKTEVICSKCGTLHLFCEFDTSPGDEAVPAPRNCTKCGAVIYYC
jgi:hypothetical protein